MAKNKRPRKPYVPRFLGTPVTIGVADDHKYNMKLIPHQMLDKLRTGNGDEVCWNTIACRLNMGYVMGSQQEFSEDPLATITLALDAMRELQARFDESGRYVVKGDELRAVGEALNLIDDMQDATTRRAQRDALRVVMETSME